MPYRALVLFDIDGTLVRRAGAHHREALSYGIRRVTGRETTTDGIPLHGMLDPVILRKMMRRAGASGETVSEALPEVMRVAERRYLRTCPPIADKLCPGVVETLERLERNGALLGLVTGNLTRIGWRKLARAGVRRYFRFGAFGELAPTRTALARMAGREARARGWIFPGTPVALIGDSPADVIAAKKNRFFSIAVRTGITPVQELIAQAPDFLLSDLRRLRLHMIGM